MSKGSYDSGNGENRSIRVAVGDMEEKSGKCEEKILPVGEGSSLRSQIVTSKRGEHIKYLPYAFTEHGILMLSSVLNSERAIKVNIEIMRAFVRLRRLLVSHVDLARKLDTLEKKYDPQFKIVFDAIRQLMSPSEPKKRPIGFLVEEPKVPYVRKMKRKT